MPATDVLIARVLATRGALLTPSLVTAGRGESPATGSPAVPPSSAWGSLAVVPASWIRVPGSDLHTPSQRFAAFLTDRGRIATLHTAYGLEPAPPPGRLVALVTLGGHRVAVESLAVDRHAATWSGGRESHRLTAPVELGEFMQLLLTLDFS